MQYFMDKKRAVPAAVGFTVFIMIAYFVATRDVLSLDSVLCESIYGMRSEGLTAFFTGITYLGNWQTITSVCVTLLILPQTRLGFGVPASVAAILATLTQKALKLSFQRARPDLSLHLINQGGYSFPSGHSFTVLIFYGMLIWLCRNHMKNRVAANLITVLLSCLIALIGFSRIYLGVHFPSDVLGGWSLGFCILMILISSILAFSEKKRKRST
jgi:undecaprenyl-diphosphatase